MTSYLHLRGWEVPPHRFNIPLTSTSVRLVFWLPLWYLANHTSQFEQLCTTSLSEVVINGIHQRQQQDNAVIAPLEKIKTEWEANKLGVITHSVFPLCQASNTTGGDNLLVQDLLWAHPEVTRLWRFVAPNTFERGLELLLALQAECKAAQGYLC